jgi:hypothetical protein
LDWHLPFNGEWWMDELVDDRNNLIRSIFVTADKHLIGLGYGESKVGGEMDGTE